MKEVNKYIVIHTPEFQKLFKKLCKKYNSLENDLSILKDEVSNNPSLGIKLFENVFKIRMAIKSKGKGKSAGARVIYYTLVLNNKIYLLTIYDKSEKESISDNRIKELIKNVGI